MRLDKVYEAYCKEVLPGVTDPRRPAYAWASLKKNFGASEKISGSDILEYIKERTKKVTGSTVRREIAVLCSIMKFGARKEVFECPSYIPRPPESAPRVHWLNEEQIEKLLLMASGYLKDFIFIGLSTGARKEAILEMTWDQVDFDTNIIDFNKSGASVRQKARAVQPISRDLRDYLWKLKKKAVGPFVVEKGGHRLVDFRFTWDRLMEDAGIKGATPHVLRHTCATRLIRQGVSILETAKWLGHRDSRVTERVYFKFSPDFLKGAAKAAEMPK